MVSDYKHSISKYDIESALHYGYIIAVVCEEETNEPCGFVMQANNAFCIYDLYNESIYDVTGDTVYFDGITYAISAYEEYRGCKLTW